MQQWHEAARHSLNGHRRIAPGGPPFAMMLRRLSLLLALGLTALPMAAQSEELIALRYATFDPIEGEPAVAPELAAVRNPGLFLVQFADKPSNELRWSDSCPTGRNSSACPNASPMRSAAWKACVGSGPTTLHTGWIRS